MDAGLVIGQPQHLRAVDRAALTPAGKAGTRHLALVPMASVGPAPSGRVKRARA
jgi:hypothetical protein